MVALSTCEAESIAGNRALQHALWLHHLLDIMHITTDNPRILFTMDNASAIKIARHKSNTHLRKHIDVWHHHMVHHVQIESIELTHIASKDNKAHILTKPIAPAHFREGSADLVYDRPAEMPTQIKSVTPVHQGV